MTFDPRNLPPGQIATYYGDIARGDLRPEDMRLETLQFSVNVNAAGQVTKRTDPKMVVSQYNFVIETIYGSVADWQTAGNAPDLISFNILEQGRNFSVFKERISLANLLQNPLAYRGLYITIPGTALEGDWAVSSDWAVKVGLAKSAQIKLAGTYVACGPLNAR